jgi:hypothetical protein
VERKSSVDGRGTIVSLIGGLMLEKLKEFFTTGGRGGQKGGRRTGG